MDNSEGLWTRGGALATFGRLFCCTIMIAVFLFISVVLSLALVCFCFRMLTPEASLPHQTLYQWVRPPSVLIGTPTINSTQAVRRLADMPTQPLISPLQVSVQGSAIVIALEVNARCVRDAFTSRLPLKYVFLQHQ